jgi:nucleoside 2-deoxyribosyltransferase
MRVFISVRFTGEEPSAVDSMVKQISDALSRAGHKPVDMIQSEPLFEREHYTNRQIMLHALKELDNCDALLCVLRSDEKSEGMLMEVGYALAKGKRIIVEVRDDVTKTYLPDMAEITFRFSNTEDLREKLTKLK